MWGYPLLSSPYLAGLQPRLLVLEITIALLYSLFGGKDCLFTAIIAKFTPVFRRMDGSVHPQEVENGEERNPHQNPGNSRDVAGLVSAFSACHPDCDLLL
jgi:hypothetical protein